jgi:hypothetical protein
MSNDVDHKDFQLWLDIEQDKNEAFEQEYIEWMDWCEYMESIPEEETNG